MRSEQATLSRCAPRPRGGRGGGRPDAQRAQVAHGVFEPILYFSHADAAAEAQVVALTVGVRCDALGVAGLCGRADGAQGTRVRLTAGHFVPVGGVLKPAGKVAVGDVLTLGDGRTAAVTDRVAEAALGLFNPHTASGTLLVDGVLVSAYTEAVHPTVAHLLLAPLRAWQRVKVAVGLA